MDWKNMGLKKTEDWEAKRHILQSIIPDGCSEGIDTFKKLAESRITFEILIHHEQFSRFIFKNLLFRLVSRTWFPQPHRTVLWVPDTLGGVDDSNYYERNALTWDGKLPLEQLVNSVFLSFRYKEGARQKFSLTLDFIQITYKPGNTTREFESFQNFHLYGRLIRRCGFNIHFSNQDFLYNICDIIRLADGVVEDGIRT